MASFLLHLVVVFPSIISAASPLEGFMQQALSYKIQKPYDLPVCERYSFKDGVHDFWVSAADMPLRAGSHTLPRTELRFFPDYTSGVWQFEGDFFVPSGTNGVCIMQVFGGLRNATALQLRVMQGRLVRYGGNLTPVPLAESIHDHWVHLNVIHDADHKQMQIFLDGELKRQEENRSNKTHYFKIGVYTQSNSSARMESLWKNVRIWKKIELSPSPNPLLKQ